MHNYLIRILSLLLYSQFHLRMICIICDIILLYCNKIYLVYVHWTTNRYAALDDITPSPAIVHYAK